MVGLAADELFNTLDTLSFGAEAEVIVSEHGRPQSGCLLLANSAMPVIVKAEGGKVDVCNIIKAINKRTKAVCLAGSLVHTGLTARSFASLRLAIPSNVLIVVDVTASQFIPDERYVLPPSVLTGNVLAVRPLPQLGGLPAFTISRKHTNLVSIRTPKHNANLFNAKNHFTTMIANRARHCPLCVGRNLFWTTKLAVEAKVNGLVVLNVCANHVTMQLDKRMPVDVVCKAL